MQPQTGHTPDVSPEQKIAAELVKRIRKPRWMGMEDEAHLVQVELASRGLVPVDPVIAIPCETD
jgi:hypothetical protein